MELISTRRQLRGNKGEFLRDVNIYRLKDGCIMWELTRGKVMYTDSVDLEILKRYTWRAHPACDGNKHEKFYAIGSISEESPLAHSLISGTFPEGVTVDHKNGDGLNNRRENLRLATKKQQRLNQARHGGQKDKNAKYTSSYRGLTLRESGKWRVRVRCVDGTQKGLGGFVDEVSAAEAWDDFMYSEYKEDFPLKGLNCNGIVGEPTINFIQFNFPERLGL